VRRWPSWALPALVVAALALVITGIYVVRGAASEPDGFRVDGNRIVGPDGERFVAHGVVAPYGTFAGGDAKGLGRVNYDAAARDFARIKRLGANTVKIYVAPRAVPPGSANARRLTRVVAAARRQDLVVFLTGFWGRPRETLPWVRRMAHAYRDDPYVWMLPMNEPGCTVQGGSPKSRECTDANAWHAHHRRYVRAIRDAGMDSPIVVNGPEYSWNVAKVAHRDLGDDNVVLGAHRYANDARTLTAQGRAESDAGWAALAERRAVVLDEVGAYNGPQFANSLAWARDMLEFGSRWVNERGGSGVIGFNWRWSDGNSMVGRGGRLTGWGRAFVGLYLRRTDD
jgi:hypothetical protein